MRHIFTILIFSITFFTYGQNLNDISVRINSEPLDSLPKYFKQISSLLDTIPNNQEQIDKQSLDSIYIKALKNSAQSGKAGKLRWNISNETLTISGVGAMPNYKYKQGKYRINSPWYPYLKSITKIVICEGVSSIGDNAFYVCDDDGLTFVNIFDSNATIDDNSSNFCGVTSVLIPNSVVNIGRNAFRNCRNLTSIVIPNSVVDIDNTAFSDCDSLSEINNYATTPQTIKPYNVFSNVNKTNCILRVPESVLADYRLADGWREFKNIVPITNE